MYETPFQSAGQPYQQPCDGSCRHGRSVVRTMAFWTAVVVISLFAFGTVTWAFGLVFHLLALVLRVVVVTAVVAFVWRRITHRR